jgi:hypothetical protein
VSLEILGTGAFKAQTSGPSPLFVSQTAATIGFFIEPMTPVGVPAGTFIGSSVLNFFLAGALSAPTFSVGVNTTTGGNFTKYNVPFSPNVGHYVLFSFNNGTATLYLDGSVVYTASGFTKTAATAGAFYVGNNASAGNQAILLSNLVVVNGYAASHIDVITLLSQSESISSWVGGLSGVTAWSAWTLQSTSGANPTNSDGGLTDFGTAGQNLATIVNATNAIYTSSSITVPPTALIQTAANGTGGPYSDTTGNLVFIPLIQNLAYTNGGPVLPSTVAIDPTFVLNGTTLTSGSTPPAPTRINPNSANTATDGRSYFVAYQLGATLKTTDVLTMSCATGWASWSGGLVGGTGGSPVTITNNTGENVESIYNLPASQRTFAVGYNLGGAANYEEPLEVRANWACRLVSSQWNYLSSTNVFDSNGLPTSIVGTPANHTSCPIESQGSNGIDSNDTPGTLGYWTLQYDDATAGVSAGNPQLTVLLTTASNCTATLTTVPGVSSTGTWNPAANNGSGAIQGITSVYNVQYTSTTPSSYATQLRLGIYPTNPTGGGPWPCSIQNLVITAPSPTAAMSPAVSLITQNEAVNPIPASPELAVDPWALAKHAGAPAIRSWSAISSFYGDSNLTYSSDITHPLPSETSWAILDGQTTNIAAISPVAYPFDVIIDCLGTTLAVNVGASDTAITVNDATHIQSGTTFLIDSEWMVASGAPTGSRVPVARAQQGTTQTTHSSSARVLVTVPFGTSSSTASSNPWTSPGNLIAGHALYLITTSGPHGLRSGWQCTISATPPAGNIGPAIDVSFLASPPELTAGITDTYSGPLTLGAAITSTTTTTITVSSPGWLATSGAGSVILIDSELMLVTNISGTTITVTRGYQSTTPATHLITAAVYPATELTINSTAASAFFTVGRQIQIGSVGGAEQMVTATSGTSGTTFWVGRGINGTTTATASSGTIIYPVVWPTGVPLIVWVLNPTQFVTQVGISSTIFPTSAPTIKSAITVAGTPNPPYTVAWTQPTGIGFIPYEMAASLASAVAAGNAHGRCILWVNIPSLATDDAISNGVDGILDRIIANISSGVYLIAQLSDECWNNVFNEYVTCAIMAAVAPNPNTGGTGFTSNNDYIAYRQNYLNLKAKAAFTAAGLNPNRVYCLQASQASTGNAFQILELCQQYTYQVDYFCYAPYFTVGDTTFMADLFVSWMPSALLSSGGTSYTIAEFRHMIMAYARAMYYFSNVASGLVLTIGGYLSQYNRGIQVGSTTGTAGNQNKTPQGVPVAGKMCFYEFNSATSLVPDGVSAWKSVFTIDQTDALLHDLCYDPAMYDTEQIFFRSLQQQAATYAANMSPNIVPLASDCVPAFGCYFADVYFQNTAQGYAEDDMYGVYEWMGQKAGYGTGAGSPGVNQNTNINTMSLTSSSAFSSPKSYAYINDSVRGQAIADWNASMVQAAISIPSLSSSGFGLSGVGIAAWNTDGVVPVPTRTASSKRWFPGLRRPVARMRLGR